MRPYLAILKDSFREAFASRVLWLMLGIIALFLIVIAPLGFEHGRSATLQRQEYTDAFGLLKQIKADSEAEKPSPGKHLWSSLSSEFRTRADKVLKAAEAQNAEDQTRERFRTLRQFRGELDEVIAKPDFYDEAAWASQPMDSELREQLGASGRSGIEAVNTVNRHALEVAFEDYIQLGDDEAVFLSYAGFRMVDTPLPLTATQQQDAVKGIVNAALAILLGVIGIFISILVTASFIPRTFEPGEITLLLSKPVSRPVLFLTKFLGGCAFTLLNATFLLVGFWLIAGLRFDVWNHNLLWCIPVYVFVFAIYYAVSAASGAIWRNAIVSVVMTIMFWVVITGVGITKGTVEELALNSSRVSEIIPAGDTLLTATAGMETQTWNGKTWTPVFSSRSSGPPAFAARFAFANSRFRPVYDAANDRIVAMQAVPGRGGATQVVAGSRASEWTREVIGNAPSAVESICVDSKGRVLLVGSSAIFHLNDAAQKELSENEKGAQKSQEWLNKMSKGLVSFGGKSSKFANLRPKKLPRWDSPASFAFDQVNDRLAVYSDGTIQVLQANSEGLFEVSVEKELDTADKAIVGIAGNRLLLVSEDGLAKTFDVATLEEIGQQTAFVGEAPKSLEVSPDGAYVAVLSHDKNVWVYDTANDKPVIWGIAGQGDISAIAFSEKNELLVADRLTQVCTYDSTSGQSKDVYSPPTTLTHKIYDYAIWPLYTVLPKPGELGNLITWLTTEQDSVALGEDPENAGLQTERIKVDIWTPIWSNLAFLIVVLGATCLYISRRDF